MKHFSRSEFTCNCGCGFDVVDYPLAEVCDAIRDHFNRPVYVHSGCRCESHNKLVGGKPRKQGKPMSGSQHLYGRAADLSVAGTAPWEVQAYVKEHFPWISVGTYISFTHVDSRTDGPKFWG